MKPADPQGNNGLRPASPSGVHIDPETGASPSQAADELVAQGLLRFRNQRDPQATRRRIDAAMQSLDHAADVPLALPPPRTRLRIPRWSWAAVAMIGLSAAAFLLGLPGERSALAQVQHTVAAMRGTGDRRYIVKLDAADESEPNGIIDTRAPGLILIQHRPPHQQNYTIVGSDAQGKWALRSDGRIERDHPDRAWPPWVTIDGESFLAESLDKLLEALPTTHVLSPPVRTSLEGSDGAYTRITASRRDRKGPHPHFVDLWINQETGLADRIEFRWDRGSGGPERNSSRQAGPDSPPPAPHTHDDDDRFPRGPHHDHDFDFDSDGPGDHGPHAHGHDHDHDHGPGGPDHHHDHDDFDDAPLPIFRWVGEEGMLLMLGSEGQGPKPGPHGGMDRGRRGPGRLIFQLVPSPALPADWFSPEAQRSRLSSKEGGS